MIVALLALAAAMMIAGVTAVIEGFPYVRLESGMAMVYGGAVVGSSGALLLGFAAVVAALKRVERAVGIPKPVVADDLPAIIAPQPKAEPPHDPIADELRLMEAPVIEPAPADRPRIEPSLVHPPTPARREPKPEPAPTADVSPKSEIKSEMELLGLAPLEPVPPRPTPPKAPPASVRAPTIATKPAPRDEVANDAAGGDPFTELMAPPAAERTPVGRYSSEGNTYVMFDDGSIDADTPKGRYTFASLDELKAFVDNGGERTTRGAA